MEMLLTTIGIALFVAVVAINVASFALRGRLKEEGLWVSVRAFGLEATGWSWFASIGAIRRRIATTQSPDERKKWRVWLRNLYLSVVMLFAMFVLFVVCLSLRHR